MDPIYSKLDELASSAKCLKCKLLFNTVDDPDAESDEIDLCEVLNLSIHYYFSSKI